MAYLSTDTYKVGDEKQYDEQDFIKAEFMQMHGMLTEITVYELARKLYNQRITQEQQEEK